MFNNTAKSVDTVAAGLSAGTLSGEDATALGYFTVQCFDKDGNLKWEAENHNLVVNTGLQYMVNTALCGGSPATNWYIGIYGSGSNNNPAAGDTMSSHGGWTEVVLYNNTTRPQCSFSTATTANPSVATNSGSAASFTMNGTATVGGAFLTSSNTKGGTAGVLFSAADFSTPGDRVVSANDVLNVTYTLSLAG
jgi:hypothetical protein